MTGASRAARRAGFTLVELMLALSITALVGAAIAGMLGAVTSGVMTHRDNRTVMIRASAAQSRLSSYVSPALAILAASDDEVVIWLADSRKGGTVHASEVRWLSYVEPDGVIEVRFVQFPDSWTQVSQDLKDIAFRPDANWQAIRQTYTDQGYMTSRRLVDGLASASVWIDDPDPAEAQLIAWNLGFAVEGGEESVRVTASSHHGQRPLNP